MNILSTDTKSYPSEYNPNGHVEIIAVLVGGTIGDYAAYIGQGTVEFVARSGDKLSFIEAKQYFPGIIEDNYRR